MKIYDTQKETHCIKKVEITIHDIIKYIKENLHLTESRDVKVDAYVKVPSGGDWSDTGLLISEHPIQVTVTWKY